METKSGDMKEPYTTTSIDGLRYIDDFITREEEEALLSGIDAHPLAWKCLNNRSLQNWGGLPHMKGMLSTPLPPFLQPLLQHVEDSELFTLDNGAKIKPNHVLVNRYRPGEGIAAHVDGPAYKPVAIIVSLGAPIVMHFYTRCHSSDVIPADPLCAILLRPRSLLVLSGPAYHDVYHEIREREKDELDSSVLNINPTERGTTLERKERFSCTVRASCRTISNPLLGRNRFGPHPRP